MYYYLSDEIQTENMFNNFLINYLLKMRPRFTSSSKMRGQLLVGKYFSTKFFFVPLSLFEKYFFINESNEPSTGFNNMHKAFPKVKGQHFSNNGKSAMVWWIELVNDVVGNKILDRWADQTIFFSCVYLFLLNISGQATR